MTRRSTRLLISALLLLPLGRIGLSAQAAGTPLPFSTGEILSYSALSSRFGRIGTGSMRVENADERNGAGLTLLAFDFSGRIGPFRVSDRTRSWVRTSPLSSVRYERRERSPLRTRSENVSIFPDDGRWENATGGRGRTSSPLPLDELSFLYFIRTLPLRADDVYSLSRHFDSGRNPVQVRVLGRRRVDVPAGAFSTVLVEMQVNGDGLLNGALRLYLTDDDARIPVRIDSSAPWVGATSLILESAVSP